MKQHLLQFFLLFCALASIRQHAAAQCQYRLDMRDEFGDGWNGGQLVVNNGGNLYAFTLDNKNDDGNDSTIYFSVAGNQPLTLLWTPGLFSFEVSFKLYDSNGDLVKAVQNPAIGLVYQGTAICPTCLKISNLVLENVWDTRARMRWTPQTNSVGASWLVIYGPPGFVPGPGVGDTLSVATPKATLTGLSKKTAYDLYVVQKCSATDFSGPIGPLSFETYWSTDVGISEVQSPQSSCDLDQEIVKFVIKNYGAKPLSLIPYNYSINDEPVNVGQPNDGFYTGVLGKDSSEVLEFETVYDFSAPGEYKITVYSQLENDEEKNNDTLNYYITNYVVPPYSQRFEQWSGGWEVSDSSKAPSWAFGEVDKGALSDGSNAWVTSLEAPYNFGEASFLESPCFDFSQITGDPVFEFSLNHRIEKAYDGAHLEVTVDEGKTWKKIGGIKSGGLNWYNFTNTNLLLGDVWTDNSKGWQIARHTVEGVKGVSRAQFRFAFNSDLISQYEGFALDDIKVYVPEKNDLTGLKLRTKTNQQECGIEKDSIIFTVSNFGTVPQRPYRLAYSINGAAPVIDTIANDTLFVNELLEYRFKKTFDSRDKDFTIQCWTMLAGEQKPSNDTLTILVQHAPRKLPFAENFEKTDKLPAGWSAPDGEITNGHNNIGYVLAANLKSSNSDFIHESARYGVVAAGDTLRFDYRITNVVGNGTIPTILGAGNRIEVQISTDCGQNYTTVYTINLLTHTPSANMRRLKIPLTAYIGQSIRFRFKGSWSNGDFFVDIDNINISSCSTLKLSADVSGAFPNQKNGSATVKANAGTAPYTYEWSNGAKTATASQLPSGPISVTVTDATGCSDALTINIGLVGAQDVVENIAQLNLWPNPTPGELNLSLRLERPATFRADVINLLGQTVWSAARGKNDLFQERIDLGAQPNGMYLLRMVIDGKPYTKKIMKSEQ